MLCSRRRAVTACQRALWPIRMLATEAAETTAESDQVPVKRERQFFKEPNVVDGFKVFDVYMNKKRDMPEYGARRTFSKLEVDRRGRYNRMSVDQDWTNVWPTSSMFKQSAVPLPVRQGLAKNKAENDGLPPVKYANTELIKIPNFLHLSPPHVKKYCAAIKKFCTPWPKELATDKECEANFPIEITTSTYIYDGPSIRDDRARVVKLQIKVSSLNLDERARDKFIKLSQHRYDSNTDTLTIVADRCPFRRQNEDYAMYLLTTLYFESKAVQDWEAEMTEYDMPKYTWEKSQSKRNIEAFLKQENAESLLKSDQVGKYKDSLSKIFDQGETKENILSYKKSVLDLLKINNNSTSATESTK